MAAAVVAWASIVAAAGCSGGDPSAAPEAPASTSAAPVATEESTSATTEPATTDSSAPSGTSDTDDTSDELQGVYDDLIDDEGEWVADGLLAVFAARVTPLPGITPADPDDAALVDDRVLFEVLGEIVDTLPADQQAIVRAWLEPTEILAESTFRIEPDGRVVEIVDGVETPVDLGDPAEIEAEDVSEPWPPPGTFLPDGASGLRRPQRQAGAGRDYVVAVLQYVNKYRSLTGMTGAPFVISTQVVNLPGNVLADATGSEGNCRVRVDDGVDAGSDTRFRANTLAHEAFHCFQFAIRGANGLTLLPRGGWVTEGTASYAALLVADSPRWSQGWYERWMMRPALPLTARAYDAIGFYRSVDEATALDMWQFMTRLVLSESPVSELGSLPAEALVHWGTGSHSDRSFNNWFRLDPYEGRAARPLSLSMAPSGAPRTISVPALTARTALLDGLTGDTVLTITSTASTGIQFSGEAETRLVPGQAVHACFSAAACLPCPNRPDLRFSSAKGPRAAVGATSLTGGEVTFVLQDKAAACEYEPAGAAGDDCAVGTWTSIELQAQPVPDELYRGGGDGVVLRLGGDGVFEINFDGMAPYLVQWMGPDGLEGPGIQDPVFETEVVFRGKTSGTWQIVDGTLRGFAGPGFDAIRIRSDFRGPGMEMNVLDTTLGAVAASLGGVAPPAGASSGSFEGMAVTCEGSRLLLSNAEVTWVFVRA